MSKSTKLRVLVALLASSLAACVAVKASPATFSAPVSAVQVEQYETVEASEIDLEATLEVSAALPSGEVVKLRFTLANKTDTNLYVLKWYTPLEGLGGEIFRVVRDGQVVPYAGPLASRAVPTPEAYVFLKLGESVSAEVDLAAAYDFTKAGEYSIEFLSPRISHVTRTEAEMAKTMDDLGPGRIPSNRVRVKIASSEVAPARATAVPPAVEGVDGLYSGWESYVNAAYSFGFRYPPAWTLEEEANLVKLSQGTLLLAIAFQHQGEDVPPPWTGMPAGDFEDRGTMAFLGHEMEKNSLVYQGKIKVLTYRAEVGDLMFSMRLDDMAAVGYPSIEISEAMQIDVDQIVGSFDTW